MIAAWLDRGRRHASIAWITPLGELNQPARLTGTLVRLTAQVILVVCVWRALFGGLSPDNVLTQEQTVTYAALAALATQMRGLNRSVSKDSMLDHIQNGTIAFWFVRPVAPRRYYMLRAVGDQIYGFAWMAGGYCVCIVLAVVARPASPATPAIFAVSFALGQVIGYQLLLLVDLLTFWTLQNQAALTIVRFVQSLLSGAIAPLWFFPHWFLTLSDFLPFRSTLDVPLSIYIGRISLDQAPHYLILQLAWCLGLAGLTRGLWLRATSAVTVHGG